MRERRLLNAALDLERRDPKELDRLFPDGFRVLSPTAILGYGFPPESFLRGIEQNPHLIAVDGGPRIRGRSIWDRVNPSPIESS